AVHHGPVVTVAEDRLQGIADRGRRSTGQSELAGAGAAGQGLSFLSLGKLLGTGTKVVERRVKVRY
ncbi:hypothetical protein, partial [Arcticibacter tournemirensis]